MITKTRELWKKVFLCMEIKPCVHTVLHECVHDIQLWRISGGKDIYFWREKRRIAYTWESKWNPVSYGCWLVLILNPVRYASYIICDAGVWLKLRPSLEHNVLTLSHRKMNESSLIFFGEVGYEKAREMCMSVYLCVDIVEKRQWRGCELTWEGNATYHTNRFTSPLVNLLIRRGRNYWRKKNAGRLISSGFLWCISQSAFPHGICYALCKK